MPQAKKRSTSSHGGRTTTDHSQIRRWAEKRGGHPATVKGTSRGGAGLLRIDFPGYRGEQSLKEISWDDFFEKFDDEKLAFLYQDKTSSGRTSRFFKLVDRDGGSARAEPGRARGSRPKGRSSAPKRTTAKAAGGSRSRSRSSSSMARGKTKKRTGK